MTGCTACAHTQDAHQHFRAGSDCSVCDCSAYRRSATSLLKQLFQRHAAAPAPEAPAVKKHVTAA